MPNIKLAVSYDDAEAFVREHLIDSIANLNEEKSQHPQDVVDIRKHIADLEAVLRFYSNPTQWQAYING